MSFGTLRRVDLAPDANGLPLVLDAGASDAAIVEQPFFIAHHDLAATLMSDGSFRPGGASLRPTHVELLGASSVRSPIAWIASGPGVRTIASLASGSGEMQLRLHFDGNPSVDVRCAADATLLTVLSFAPGTLLAVSSRDDIAQAFQWRFEFAPSQRLAVRCHSQRRHVIGEYARVVVGPSRPSAESSFEISGLDWSETSFVEQRHDGSRVELGTADCHFAFRSHGGYEGRSMRLLAAKVHPELASLRSLSPWGWYDEQHEAAWTSRAERSERVWLCQEPGPAEDSIEPHVAVDIRHYTAIVAEGARTRSVHAVLRWTGDERGFELAPAAGAIPRGVACCREHTGTIVPCTRMTPSFARVRTRRALIEGLRRPGCVAVFQDVATEMSAWERRVRRERTGGF